MQNVLSTIVPVQAKQQLNDVHQKVRNINVVCVQTFLGKTTCIHHNVSIRHRKPTLKTLSPASPNSQGCKQYFIFTTAVSCKLWIVHGTCTKGMKLDTVRFMDLYMKHNISVSAAGNVDLKSGFNLLKTTVGVNNITLGILRVHYHKLE